MYRALVNIENICPELQPDAVMKDFELVTLNAAETVFSRASLVYRHEKEKGGNRDIRYSSRTLFYSGVRPTAGYF